MRANSPLEFDYKKMKVIICKQGRKVMMKAVTEQTELKLIFAKAMSKLFKRGVYRLCG